MVPDTPRPPLARRRGTVRRRHRGPRRRREPLPRRGRRRAGRRGLRAAARGRRLRGRRGRRKRSCTRAAGNLAGEIAGAPAETIADAYDRAAHVVSETIWSRRRRRPDGDPRPGRGVVQGQRRADRVGRHAGPARGAAVRRPAARHPRAQRPGDHPRRRRRLRPEGRRRCARTSASCSRRGGCRAPVKWIEDRRENLQCRGHSTARARRRPARLRRGRDAPRRVARPRPGRRRVPDAVAGRDGRRPG